MTTPTEITDEDAQRFADLINDFRAKYGRYELVAILLITAAKVYNETSPTYQGFVNLSQIAWNRMLEIGKMS